MVRNIGEFLRDGATVKVGDKEIRIGSGSDIEILPKITARFDVAKTKFGWIGDKEEQEKRKKLGPREYKYSEYGLPSWSGLGGIPILSKYSREESETTNTKRWNKASEAERRKYLERMKAIYEESKKELIKDFGAEFLLGKQK